jgi:hypothetical protein
VPLDDRFGGAAGHRGAADVLDSLGQARDLRSKLLSQVVDPSTHRGWYSSTTITSGMLGVSQCYRS